MTINPGKKASLVILPFWMKQMLTNSGEKEKSVSSKVKDQSYSTNKSLLEAIKKKEREDLIIKSFIQAA